jgi:hypothetical protein
MRNLFIVGSICLMAAAQSSGWHYQKDDPVTKKKIVEIEAASFHQIADGQAKLLHDVTVRFYNSAGSSYKQISSQEAIVDQKSDMLIYGPHLKMAVRLIAQN